MVNKWSIFDCTTGERVSKESYASSEEANHDYHMNQGHTFIAPVSVRLRRLMGMRIPPQKTPLQKALTPDQFEALEWALGVSHEEQGHYLDMGDFATDYGDEWAGLAEQRAKYAEQIAAILGPAYGGWGALAQRYRDSLIDEDVEASDPNALCECGRRWNDCKRRDHESEHGDR